MSHLRVVADKLDSVAIGICDVEGAPVHPLVGGRRHGEPKHLQPPLLGLVVRKRDGEREMVDRAVRLLDGRIAVEERKHGRVPSVAIRDSEKGSVLEAPHELEADHVRIESLTLIEIVDTQRHLSESPHSRRHYRLRSGRAEPRL